MAGNLQKTGVEAVVENLNGFKSGIEDINKSIESIGSKGNFLTRALGGAVDILDSFGASVLRIAEHTLGELLADAIEYVIVKLKELVAETIEAGAEFQTMLLRLGRFNFNTAIESGMKFGEAMRFAKDMTQEQMAWLQKLAVTTPYDAQDIANVFTLARSYGFAAEEAQGLTQDISNFVAGMSLGNTEMERIIVNFGQMVQQGKVTQREMNDLARGAFVPVNDILKRMQENVGLTGAEFDKFRSSGEGVNAFMTAFSQIVKERFEGAAQAMARTFQGATDNAKDFVKSLIGFGVVRPILDKIGGRIADLTSSLTTTERWDALTKAAASVGLQISTTVDQILGLLPSSENLADRIVEGLNSISDWVNKNRGRIVAFFSDLKKTLGDLWDALKSGDLEGFLKALGLDESAIGNITTLKDGILKVFDTIKGWVSENGPLIKKFFETLGEIVRKVFKGLTKNLDKGGLEGFLDTVAGFMQYVIDNQDKIAWFVTLLGQLWGWLQVIGLAMTILAPPILFLVGIILSFASVIIFFGSVLTAVTAIVTFFLTPLGLIIIIIGAIIGIIALLVAGILWLVNHWQLVVERFQVLGQQLRDFLAQKFLEIKDEVIAKLLELKEGAVAKFLEMVEEAKTRFSEMKTAIMEKMTEIKNAILDIDWKEIGKMMIRGITKGVISAATGLVNAMINAVRQAYDAAMNAISAKSPSRLFMNVGEAMMLGMSKGIDQFAAVAGSTMEKAMGEIAMPAISMSAGALGNSTVNRTSSVTNNFALTVNSAAKTEPIIQDYGMLQALVQG